jgi:hypothetical protein
VAGSLERSGKIKAGAEAWLSPSRGSFVASAEINGIQYRSNQAQALIYQAQAAMKLLNFPIRNFRLVAADQYIFPVREI